MSQLPPVNPWIRPQPQPTRLAYLVRMLDRVCNQPFHTTMGTYYEDAMLTVILSGRGRYRRGHTVQHVEAGMVGLVVGRDGEHPGLLMADPNAPYDHIHCRFAGHEALEIAQRIETLHDGEAFVYTPHWRRVVEVLERALEVGPVHNGGDRRDHPIQQDAALMEALVLLGSTSLMRTKGVTAAGLEAYLHNHIAAPAALEPMAKHFGISRSHLCRLSHQLLGLPVHKYWMQLKIQWAKTLLLERGFTVTEVARRVGFSDPFHFSKTFKRVAGVSPRQWRREATQDDGL